MATLIPCSCAALTSAVFSSNCSLCLGFCRMEFSATRGKPTCRSTTKDVANVTTSSRAKGSHHRALRRMSVKVFDGAIKVSTTRATSLIPRLPATWSTSVMPLVPIAFPPTRQRPSSAAAVCRILAPGQVEQEAVSKPSHRRVRHEQPGSHRTSHPVKRLRQCQKPPASEASAGIHEAG